MRVKIRTTSNTSQCEKTQFRDCCGIDNASKGKTVSDLIVVMKTKTWAPISPQNYLSFTFFFWGGMDPILVFKSETAGVNLWQCNYFFQFSFQCKCAAVFRILLVIWRRIFFHFTLFCHVSLTCSKIAPRPCASYGKIPVSKRLFSPVM